MSDGSTDIGMQGYVIGLENWAPITQAKRNTVIVALRKSGRKHLAIIEGTGPITGPVCIEDPITHFMEAKKDDAR